MRTAVGLIRARISELDYPYYRVDFTRHNNEWDSDDEEDDWQWSYSIRFFYERRGEDLIFLNTDEIEYDMRERYTAKVFRSDYSTSIVQMVRDTITVRAARGERIPPWPLSTLGLAAEAAWDRRH